MRLKGVTFKDMTLMILLVIVVIFLVTKAQGSVIEAAQNSAVLTCENIAGVVNTMQSAPNATYHEIKLPKTNCTIKIEYSTINVTINYNKQELTHVMNVIDTKKKLVPAVLHCKDTEEVTVTVKTIEDKIYIV